MVVCHDMEVAGLLLGAGAWVVLYGPAPEVAAAMPGLGEAGGRLAVLVGDPADDEVAAVARSMARELFGEEPQAVSSTAHAAAMAALSGSFGTPPTAIPNPPS